MKMQYLQGRDANKALGTMKTVVTYHKDLSRVLQAYHIVTPCYTHGTDTVQQWQQ